MSATAFNQVSKSVVSEKLGDVIRAAYYNHITFNGKAPPYLVLSAKAHEALSHECEMDFYDSSERRSNRTLKKYFGMTVIIAGQQAGQFFEWTLGV